MARTARNTGFAVMEAQAAERVYKTAIYVRLSVLDGNKDDGDSIENQESLLREYIGDKPSFELQSVYSDNGETGVNFERSGFELLIEDIKNGSIDCVIVKDLSRFGRNYIEAGEYIEKIFPFLGIRFIAVNDGYDNVDPLTADNFSMHLKNLVNDVYARDISQKICPVLRMKQENGEFLGAWAAYGYLKSDVGFVIDEETAPVVRNIFAWRLAGLSYQMIVRKLTELSIPSPSRYRFEKGLVKNKRFENCPWRVQTITTILSNHVYLGHMVQGRKREALYLGQKQTILPEEEWIIVKNTHEAIVSQDVFDAVRQIAAEIKQAYREKLKFADVGNPENILKGLIVCGECGSHLVRYKNVRVNKHKEPKHRVWYNYICPKHAANPQSCSFISIRETAVLDTVSAYLRKMVEAALDTERLMNSRSNRMAVASERDKLTMEIEKAQQSLVRIQRYRERLYDDYLEELLTERDYLYSQNRYKEQETELNTALEALLNRQTRLNEEKTKENPWVKSLLPFSGKLELTPAVVAELVDSVTVYADKRVHVLMRFQDEYERLKDRLRMREAAGHE